MHATTIGHYGWHFFVTKRDGSRDHYTLEALDQQFQLGVRGATWEASVLARQVARLTGGEVEVTFNGVPISTASPL
ncbi:MAG TPA: hypothetical protein VNN10_08675 [Dehalococcoidia bacterium]|nr:hypothetical protein [Dehalococcoidia bacterium]